MDVATRSKSIIKALLPAPIRQTVLEYRARQRFPEYRALTTEQVFAKIYDDGAWGRSPDPEQRFFSGSGSHEPAVVDAYVEAVRRFLQSLGGRPDAVDLGCGDFGVGSRIRDLCGRYVACDIVTPLIEFNRQRYASLDVDFRVLDLTTDDLPRGDVVFIRQVLQHLSNEQILRALPQISTRFTHLVVSEHLPAGKAFSPNIDKAAGPGIRLSVESGVVLTDAPFNLRPKSERVLCEVPESGGVIRTLAYRLA